MQRQGSRERLGPLLLDLVGLGLSLPLTTKAYQAAGFSSNDADKLAAATAPVFVALLNLLWLHVRERAKTAVDRLGEVRNGAVTGDATVVVLALGLFTAGVVAGIQVLLLLPVDRAINWTLQHGWLRILIPDQAQFGRDFYAYLKNLLFFFWFPLTILASIGIGKFGYHRLGRRPIPKLLAVIVLSAVVFLLIKLGFALSVTTELDRIVKSLRPSVEDIAKASLAVLFGFLVAVQWARRAQHGFLFSRLMLAAPQQDRTAILELLEQSSPSTQTAPKPSKAPGVPTK